MIRATTSPGFTYDHLTRLATVVGGASPGESLRYEYSGDRITGAMTNEVSPVRRLAFGYDAQSNLSYVTTFDASGAATKTICLVHDALGRMTLAGERSAPLAAPDGTGCQVESEVVLPLARFGYDAQNRRVSREDAGGTRYFAFSPSGETLGEYTRSGTSWQAVREYVWLDGRPVAQEEHPTATERYTYFVHVDHIGLPRALTNQSGQEVWRATARPYGDIDETSFTDPVSGRAVVTNLRLPGQYDERLFSAAGIDLKGPYYNWNRWYLPSLGRYLELDPIAKAGGFNGEYGPNWYGYAEGNPLRWTDPEGLEIFESCWMKCIESNTWSANFTMAPFSSYGKAWLGFRVPEPTQPLTTLPSGVQFWLERWGLNPGNALRNFGRKVSPVGTALTIAEGFWDIGAIGTCAAACGMEKDQEQKPCK